MKKVYVNPTAEITTFQFEDIITNSGVGGVTTNAVGSTFSAAGDSEGIGAGKVVEFDFNSL